MHINLTKETITLYHTNQILNFVALAPVLWSCYGGYIASNLELLIEI